MLLNTGSGGIDVFEVKLTLEMLTVCGQQHSFSAHERLFLGKVKFMGVVIGQGITVSPVPN